jgi:hypothetical protein
VIGTRVRCFYDGKGGRGTQGVVVGQQGNRILVEFTPWGDASNPPSQHWFTEPAKRKRPIHWRRSPWWDASVRYHPDHPTLMECIGVNEGGDYYKCIPERICSADPTGYLKERP